MRKRARPARHKLHGTMHFIAPPLELSRALPRPLSFSLWHRTYLPLRYESRAPRRGAEPEAAASPCPNRAERSKRHVTSFPPFARLPLRHASAATPHRPRDRKEPLTAPTSTTPRPKPSKLRGEQLNTRCAPQHQLLPPPCGRPALPIHKYCCLAPPPISSPSARASRTGCRGKEHRARRRGVRRLQCTSTIR